MDNPKLQELLNALSLDPNAAAIVQKRLEFKQRKEARAKNKLLGHQEPVLCIPVDRVGQGTKLSKQELFEQKSNEYADLFIENPKLKTQAEEYFAPEPVLNKRQIKYRAQVAEAKAIALETLSALAGENLDSIGRRKHLTAFQKEVLEHLKIAASMGVEIPFLFEGNIDPKLEALKLEATLIKHEGDSEDLEAIITSMSPEERAAYQAVAAEVLNNLMKEDR